jgi:hypothetical protein
MTAQTTFYDNALPALTAADYQIVIDHSIEVDQVAEPAYGAVQRFRVTGPRLALGPTDVVAMRPAAGSSGAYESWLPHVVLAQRTLPWQIPLADDPGGVPHGTPWLALILLTPSEIDVAGEPPASGTTGRQVVPLGQVLAPPSGIVGPTPTAGLRTIAAEQPGATTTVVDVHLDAFRAIAPTIAELPWLAHVRQVDAADQEALDVAMPGWYSVIVGSRFPVGAANNEYIAHLVSLEGLSSYLPGGSSPSTAGRLRLISLASWSFTSTPDPGDFASLVQDLDVRPLALPVSITADDAPSQQLATALDAGYVPLRYFTRLGEETTTWFRGPLSPSVINTNAQPAYPTSAAALIYDPVTGMFDSSYAAAWEIGRLLTLSNGPVAASLAGLVSGALQASRLLLRNANSAAAGGLDQARLLIARTVAPLLNDRSAALGPRGNAHGLPDVRLPGLLEPNVLERLYDEGPSVYNKVRDEAISLARGAPGEDA